MPRLKSKKQAEAVAKGDGQTRQEFVTENQSRFTPTNDSRPPFTPTQVAKRWSWHPESLRRALRERRIASIIISRRRLIPASEIERIESEGFIARAV